MLKNSVGFATPAVILGLLALNVVPMAWTFLPNAYLPLYAFLWCTIGFSGMQCCVPNFSCLYSGPIWMKKISTLVCRKKRSGRYWMKWKSWKRCERPGISNGGADSSTSIIFVRVAALYSAPSTSSAAARIFSIARSSNWVFFGLIWTIFVPRLR